MKIEQAALFGAGSVGGSLLCRQRENLDKIKVIVHGSRRERMEKEGLLTRGETFFPKIWEKGSYPDLLMVGLKNTQLKASIAELRDYVRVPKVSWDRPFRDARAPDPAVRASWRRIRSRRFRGRFRRNI